MVDAGGPCDLANEARYLELLSVEFFVTLIYTTNHRTPATQSFQVSNCDQSGTGLDRFLAPGIGLVPRKTSDPQRTPG